MCGLDGKPFEFPRTPRKQSIKEKGTGSETESNLPGVRGERWATDFRAGSQRSHMPNPETPDNEGTLNLLRHGRVVLAVGL